MIPCLEPYGGLKEETGRELESAFVVSLTDIPGNYRKTTDKISDR